MTSKSTHIYISQIRHSVSIHNAIHKHIIYGHIMLFSFLLFAHADPFLDVQLTGFHTSAQFLDDELTQQDEMTWLRSRIRAGYSITPHKNWLINTQIEVANARIAGDFSDLGTDVHLDLFRVQQSDRSDLLYILPRDLSIRYSNETWGEIIGFLSSAVLFVLCVVAIPIFYAYMFCQPHD